MSLEDYERLIEIANNPARDIKFAFSLASDKKTLWFKKQVFETVSPFFFVLDIYYRFYFVLK